MKHRVFLLALPLLLAALFASVPEGVAQASGPEAPPAPAPGSSPSSPHQRPGPLVAGWNPSPRKEAPLGLTASDGTGLTLVGLRAQAVVEGPLAFTEISLTFENPEDRVLEGRFQITLPDKAAISRFAMKIGDQWQEAEVVERRAAQAAYEDFLHRRQDPALLENAAGNEFSARIFPIPARGRKELVLSYSQELAGGVYRLPLQGLPRIGRLELSAQVASRSQRTLAPEIQSIRRENFVPEGDFVVTGGEQPQALRAGDYLVARVVPPLERSASSRLEDLLVLVDTSASRALGQADQAGKVAELLAELSDLKAVTVAAFDQEVKVLYRGEAKGFSSAALQQRQALGATDLAAALRWAARQEGHRRLLLVSDGVATAGSEEVKAALQGGGLERVDVWLVGGIRDKERMETLVNDGLPQDGLLLDGELEPGQVAQRLALGVRSGVDVAVDGAMWVWPQTLDNLQPGDARLIYAQLKEGAGPLRLTLGGQEYTVEVKESAVSPLLERQAMVARLARLESLWKEAPAEKKDSLGREIVELSTRHRVLSDKTALLVLETEQDYVRFGIDRRALREILVVGSHGLELRSRDRIVVAETREVAKSEEVRPEDRSRDSGASSPRGEEASASHAPASPEGDGRAAPVRRDLPASAPRPQIRRASLAPSTSSSQPRAQERHDREADSAPVVRNPARPAQSAVVAEREQGYAPEPLDEPPAVAALSGLIAEIESLLGAGQVDLALAKAQAWLEREPGHVLALIALAQCLEAKGEMGEAARAYGAIIDLFPARADLRRYAGSRLEALGKAGLALAVDSFTKAVEQRPDHVSSHRYLALGLARQGRYEAAFQALERGLQQSYPSGRFLSYDRILRDDLGIIGAAWAKASPERLAAIEQRLAALGSKLATQPSLRFVLTWETDANDVDFHIRDGQGGHAFYGSPALPGGGELYGDVTTGYGPECFAIPGKATGFPYRLQIHYFSRGPMGYGMGQLEILQHDGRGGLAFEERPYLVMEDGATVDLGLVERPLRSAQ